MYIYNIVYLIYARISDIVETRYNEAPLKCSLSGYWYNNLGSKAVFSQQTDDNNAVNG